MSLWFTPLTSAQTTSTTAAHQQFVFAYRLLQRGEYDQSAQAFDDYLGRFPTDEKRGDGLYFRALVARQLGDNAKVIELLSNPPSVTLVPPSAPALLLGQALADAGRHDDALKALEPIKLDTLDPATRASLLYLRSVAYRGTGNLPAAEAQLADAANIDSPVRARALVDLGRVRAQQDKLDEAIAALDQALKLKDPQVTPEAARLAGDVAYKAGKFDQAQAFFQTVLTGFQTSAHFAPSVVGLMWAQFQNRQYDAVLATFNAHKNTLTGVEGDTAQYLAGSAHQEAGRHDQAVALFTSIVASGAAPQIGDRVLLKLATSHFDLGRYELMEQAVTRLLQTYPDSPLRADAQFLLASADARRGDPARGAARLTEIINQGQSNPYYAQALLHRANLYESSNQLEPAVKDYQAYLAAMEAAGTPKAAWPATLRLIDAYTQLEKFEEARAAAAKLAADPQIDAQTEPEALYRLMLAQVRLGQHNEALSTAQTLLSKHPRNVYLAQATYYRGLLQMTLGETDVGVKDLLAAAAIKELPDALRANALRLSAIKQREQQADDAAAGSIAKLHAIVGMERLLPDEQLWMGEHLTGKGKPREALAYLQPLLQNAKVPADQRARAMYATADCLRQLGDMEGAMQALRQVVATGGGMELQARLELAGALASTGKIDDALAEYEGLTSVEQSRIAATALFESGRLHRQKAAEARRNSNAAAASDASALAYRNLKKMVLLFAFPELSPLPELGYIELSETADELGNALESESFLRELTEKFPDGPYAMYAKALLAARQGQKGDAAFLLKKARATPQLDPRLADRITRELANVE